MIGLDPECVRLIGALNRVPGVRTLTCCSGHGKHELYVFVDCLDIQSLGELLQLTDPPAADWFMEVVWSTQVGRPWFYLHTRETGAPAYEAAEVLSARIEEKYPDPVEVVDSAAFLKG